LPIVLGGNKKMNDNSKEEAENKSRTLKRSFHVDIAQSNKRSCRSKDHTLSEPIHGRAKTVTESKESLIVLQEKTTKCVDKGKSRHQNSDANDLKWMRSLDFEIEDPAVGEGMYGIVFKTVGKDPIALKLIKSKKFKYAVYKVPNELKNDELALQISNPVWREYTILKHLNLDKGTPIYKGKKGRCAVIPLTFHFGITIGEYLSRKRTIEELLKIYNSCKDAICALHQRGVIHNDLHLYNIIFNADDSKVFIVDYGMCQLLSETKWKEEYFRNFYFHSNTFEHKRKVDLSNFKEQFISFLQNDESLYDQNTIDNLINELTPED
jgi:tRNA A-37 threonylcarbamoyl transferase component Bud32